MTNAAGQELSEVVKMQPEPQAQASIAPPAILERAMASGNLELVAQAMTLNERWEKNLARKEFDRAVAAVKAKIPPIVKNRTGHNNKKYADLAAIAKEIDPIIAEHGLAYRFRTQQDERGISVTCILSHSEGHFEENTLRGPADTSGNKNAIQSIGSTLTYLQRYSLVQSLGLAAAEDDDGNAAGNTGTPITMDQAKVLRDRLDKLGIKVEYFYNVMAIKDITELTDKTYEIAMRKLDLNEQKQKKAAEQKAQK